MPRNTSLKLEDSSIGLSLHGRLDQWWQLHGMKRYYEKLRPGMKYKELFTVISSHQKTLDKFKIRGIEFGRWVTNEDRFNYLAALIIALYDLNKVLKFNYNIGLEHHLGIAFGARGAGRASAHFEPYTNIINLTRYDKTTKAYEKEYEFTHSGGVGALAHEYGHFLDYFFGRHVDQDKKYSALTKGRTVDSRFKNPFKPGTIRYLANEVVYNMIRNEKGELSSYYVGLQKHFDTEYWFRHNELFARGFEQYIRAKLNKIGVNNKFLAKEKYEHSAYMSKSEFARVFPLFEKLMEAMRKHINK